MSGSALDNNGNPLTDAGGRSDTSDFEIRMVQAASAARERSGLSTILPGDASRSLGRWERRITSNVCPSRAVYLCIAQSINELRKGCRSILPLTFTKPRVPKNLTELGQTT